MKFSEEFADSPYRITGYGAGWIQVNQQRLNRSFLLGGDTLVIDWQPQSLEQLLPEHLDALFALRGDVILLGTGGTQRLPAPEIWRALAGNGVGFELMPTPAACRTYNLLLGEARRVAAAFFIG